MSEDRRPANCRFRLRDEGKKYPKGGCDACKRSVVTGLADVCTYINGLPSEAKISEEKEEETSFEEKKLIADFYAQVAAINYTVNDLAKFDIEVEYQTMPHSSIGKPVDILILQGKLRKVLKG